MLGTHVVARWLIAGAVLAPSGMGCAARPHADWRWEAMTHESLEARLEYAASRKSEATLGIVASALALAAGVVGGFGMMFASIEMDDGTTTALGGVGVVCVGIWTGAAAIPANKKSLDEWSGIARNLEDEMAVKRALGACAPVRPDAAVRSASGGSAEARRAGATLYLPAGRELGDSGLPLGLTDVEVQCLHSPLDPIAVSLAARVPALRLPLLEVRSDGSEESRLFVGEQEVAEALSALGWWTPQPSIGSAGSPSRATPW